MSPRLGLALIPSSVEDAVGLAQEAEHLGFDSLFIPDQTFQRDPFTLLALCAQATDRIRLGLGLTNPYTRHPVQIARAAGVVAELSGGRFMLGFGAGNRPDLLRGFGLEQTQIVMRIREAVTVTRRLLAGETVSHESPTLTVDGVQLEFDPGYEVPIVIGARGAKVLGLAGEIADAVLIESLFTPGGRAWALERIAGQPGVDRDRLPEVMAWQIMSVDGPHGTSEALLRRWATLLIKTSRRDMLDAVGVSDASIQAASQDAGSVTGGAGSDGIDQADIGKVILKGTARQIAARAADLEADGIGQTVGVLMGDAASVRGQMRTLAAEIGLAA